MKHVAAWGRWLIWDGSRWAEDDTLRAFDLSRGICSAASARALRTIADARTATRTATKVASAQVIGAVLKIAQADRSIARTADIWDADPWLLNTPAGMVDLRTGTLSPHDRGARCTKITAVGPASDRDADCPLWTRFLREITGGDAELQAYLQRAVGYCLTGSVREHALFFAHGPGGNGKGVFLNTVAAILGDYATVASMDSFTATHTDRHPTDMAMLRGARLVTAQETEEGRRWAEARIKALTGGDPITARFMRQDFFTYQPQFKLFVAGNHKPSLRNIDDAIRRRLHLIPFTFKPARPDRDLPEKLKPEWPAILDLGDRTAASNGSGSGSPRRQPWSRRRPSTSPRRTRSAAGSRSGAGMTRTRPPRRTTCSPTGATGAPRPASTSAPRSASPRH